MANEPGNRLKVVYIAGPFTAPTAWEIEQNVRRAEEWALRVALLGAMPLCPHTNTRFFHGQGTPEFWYEGTLALLKRCDGALFLPSWVDSNGCRAEHRWCEENQLPHFGVGHVTGGEFQRWLRTGVAS